MTVEFDHDVFLACADADHDAVRELVRLLRRAGAELRLCCPSLDLPPGASQNDLARARMFVPIVSRRSAMSYELTQRIQAAIPSITADPRRRILPVYLDDTPPAYVLRRVVALRSSEHEGGLPAIAWNLVRTAYELQGRPLPQPESPGHEDERLRGMFAERRIRSQGGMLTHELDEQIGRVKGEIRRGGVIRAGDVLGGRYPLIELIGHGGFAKVFRAWDEIRQRIVAVKVLHGRVAEDRTQRERFARGIRKMQELVLAGVPGIVRVLEDVLEDDGFFYCVLEYLAGLDLQRAMSAGRVAPSGILDLVLELGQALQMAHEHRLIHRDVKPTNILLDHAGMPKLTDFDLVWAADTSGGTQAGPLGTFIFSSPEALDRGDQVDCRTDVYSLAMVTVYGLHGSELPPTVFRYTNEFLDRLECRPALRRVLARALDWDRERRHASVAEFCADLERARARAQEGELITAAALDSERVYRNVVSALFHVKTEPVMIHDRYRLQDRLGRGANGHVHRAYDAKLGREVALKLFSAERREPVSEGVRARLLGEAQHLARLSHPNVVQIFDVEVDGDPIFIAMELIHGTNVAEWIEAHRPSFAEIMKVFRAAGQGLAAAHAARLVHRDFKAHNVLIQHDPWRVCVTDFGLARLHDEAHEHQHPGGWSGTPGYMAPEQEANVTTPASDQFSFCAALFKALYGELPYAAHSAAAIAASDPPTPTRSEDVPEWVLPVLQRGLAPAPDARFDSMDALLRALRRAPAVRKTRARPH